MAEESPFTGTLQEEEAAFTGPLSASAFFTGPMAEAEAFEGPISGSESLLGTMGVSILNPEGMTDGAPIGPDSTFNVFGAPIAILGGVFTNGLPLSGPFSQVFRSTGPIPFTVFESTPTSSGPIGGFLIGAAGDELQFGPAALSLAIPVGGGF